MGYEDSWVSDYSPSFVLVFEDKPSFLLPQPDFQVSVNVYITLLEGSSTCIMEQRLWHLKQTRKLWRGEKKDALDSEFQQFFFFFLHSGKCSCRMPKMNQCDKEVERRNRWKGFLRLKFWWSYPKHLFSPIFWNDPLWIISFCTVLDVCQHVMRKWLHQTWPQAFTLSVFLSLSVFVILFLSHSLNKGPVGAEGCLDLVGEKMGTEAAQMMCE